MLNKEMKSYVEESYELAKQLVRELCAIPAPSGLEDKRAEYMMAWFKANGGKNVVIDKAKNVVCSYNVKDETSPLIVIMGHLDTVFPDLEPMPFVEKDGKYFCPGVTDDTANLTSMVMAARYIMQNNIPTEYGILFVANSCEEGLGNLKGSREIVKTYGSRIKHFITVDGTIFNRIVTSGVGSHRYKVTLKTEGGHSFTNFGNRNAIACLANMITALYSVKVPVDGDSKTTYNVGTIQGGTSVNTIAQEATMLYEYRSSSAVCLEKMKSMFNSVVEAYKAMGLDIEVEKIGDRPVGVEPETQEAKDLLEMATNSIKKILGQDPLYTSGSTDANVPLSQGIPAICITGALGGGCHTREEWLDIASLKTGVALILDFLSNYFA